MRMWRNWQHRIRPLPVGDEGTFGVPKKAKAFFGEKEAQRNNELFRKENDK